MTIYILQTVLLIALMTLLGYGVLVWWNRKIALNFLLVVGLSFALGAALISALAVTLILLDKFDLVVPLVWVFSGLGLASATLAWGDRTTRPQLRKSLRIGRQEIALSTLAALILIPLALHSVLYPLASWDTKMIWLVKAKALYIEPTVPNTLYESDLFVATHKDYPIGFPALTATHFAWYGGVTEQPVALTYVTFFAAILAILLGAIKLFVPGRTYLVSVLALLIMAGGDVIAFAGLGLADVPLALYFLIATLGLSAALRARTWSQAASWVTLGLVATLSSALVKNEAYPFVLLYCLVAGFILWRLKLRLNEQNVRHAAHSRLGWLVPLGLTALVALPVVLWQRRMGQLAYGNDLTSNLRLHSPQYYLDRGIEIINWFLRELVNFDHWGWALLPALLLGVIGVVWLMRVRPRPWLELAPLTLLALQLFGYAVIYLIGPHDLTWHITTSLDRLLIHLVPGFFLGVLCIWAELLKREPD